MHIEPVPCLHDNYAYLISVPDRAEVAVVDASESEPVLAALTGRRLAAVLTTHHHHDHVGGNLELAAHFAGAGLEIYGHAAEMSGERRIPGQTRGLGDGEEFEILGLRGQALFIPGHTRTAIAFYFPKEGVLFTGDTLFGAGCGRLFEGTPPQMRASLGRLLALPPETRMYPGHEYAEKNLKFAATLEAQSEAVAERQRAVARLRKAGAPSVPSTLAEEAATNPLVRWDAPAVQKAVAGREAVLHETLDADEVFARVRKWRDVF